MSAEQNIHKNQHDADQPEQITPVTDNPVSGHDDLFRVVVDAAPTGIMMLDEDGVIVMVNKHLTDLFGYTKDEMVGQPVEMLMPARIRASHPGKVRSFFMNPAVRAMGAGRDLYAARHDQTEFPVEIGLTPIDFENRKNVLATIVDITERKETEKQIARNRDQFNAVVEAAPTGIVMIDKDGRITLVNCLIESLFGYSRSDIIGQPIEMLLPVRMRSNHPDMVRNFFTSPEARSMGAGRDLYAARQDGTEFPVEIGLNPIDLHNGRQVLATIVDITARKNAQQKLKRANEGLEQFVYVASHDLRSPLRGISDLLEWIQEDIADTPNPKVSQNLERASIRVSRLEKLITDLLSYARAGDTGAEIVSFDPTELVNQVLEMQPLRAGFSVTLDIAVPLFEAARTPIETVLRNLVANTIKHHDMNEGEITIRIRDTGKFVEFTVEDDGPGIPSHAQDRIFKLFQTATSNERQSSGVGLAVSKRLVEAHGGWMAVESKDEQRGTIMHFYWPHTTLEV